MDDEGNDGGVLAILTDKNKGAIIPTLWSPLYVITGGIMREIDCEECGSTNISWVEIRWTDFTVMQKKYQDVPYCVDCFDKVAEATPFNKIITDEVEKVIEGEIDNQINQSKGV